MLTLDFRLSVHLCTTLEYIDNWQLSSQLIRNCLLHGEILLQCKSIPELHNMITCHMLVDRTVCRFTSVWYSWEQVGYREGGTCCQSLRPQRCQLHRLHRWL